MPLPPKPFHGITEIASRWQVDPLVIVGWAIEGRLTLSAALPHMETADGRQAGGLLIVAGEDVFALFNGEQTVRVRRFRRETKGQWEAITSPPDGVPVRAAGVVLARSEVERFERVHRLFVSEPADAGRFAGGAAEPRADGPAPSRVGAPARYDWDAFSGAMARRVFDHGMPESPGELVRDMIEWFAVTQGAAPDESTVRRRVNAAWRELTRPG